MTKPNIHATGNIAIVATETGWAARFSGPAAADIRRLFGTDTIPTAFTPQAPAERVRLHLEASWPRCIVSISAEGR